MRMPYVLLVVAVTFLASSEVVSEEVKGIDEMKVKMASGHGFDAAQIDTAAGQRFLRTHHKKSDTEDEERGIDKKKMLIDLDHRLDIYGKWYAAGHDSMWAYNRLKVDKYEQYWTLYNLYALYRLARDS
ncbi:hypothetical protein PHYBOEH_011320 [Phytophthora boehmeriae]|uniref:RxLR effector protein n=1 Tax=Phytophthora boehmeriae TaxID=109152 RepID=A0A8T1WXI6_9STRA|nr:hypothetical protein PHYBOEH_011320 [Phytophthora boehmeriae]